MGSLALPVLALLIQDPPEWQRFLRIRGGFLWVRVDGAVVNTVTIDAAR